MYPALFKDVVPYRARVLHQPQGSGRNRPTKELSLTVTRMILKWMLIAGVIVCSAQAAQSERYSQAKAPAAEVDQSKPPVPPIVPHIVLPVPRSISPEEMQVVAFRLGLTESQLAIVQSLYTRFCQRENQLRWELFPVLWDWSVRLMRDNRFFTDPDATSALSKLVRDHENALRALETVQQEFFSEIELLLNDNQRLRLFFVSLPRARGSVEPDLSEFGDGKMDIATVYYSLAEKSNLELAEPVVAIFDGYEQQASQLWREYLRARYSWQSEEPTARVIMKQVATQDAQDKFVARMQRANAQIALAARKIVELNLATVQHLLSVTTESIALELRREFCARAFPPIFPDPYEFHSVAAMIVLRPELTSQQQEAIEEIYERHKTSAERLASELVQRYLARMEEFYSDRLTRPDEHDRYKRDMDLLQKRRRENAEAAVRELVSVLTWEQQQALSPSLKAFAAAVAEHKPAEHGIDYRP
jgi:hypothetical protein